MHASLNATRVKPTSTLDRFLYAPIREDANGLMVTVLSAMARQELDPWEEAARWTQLARSSAIQRVTELIATLPNVRPLDETSIQAANRLVTLLPRGRGTASGNHSEEDHESRKVGFTMLGLMALLLIQWLIFRDAAADFPDNSTTADAASHAQPALNK